ncbi:hypothetical protein PIB30_096112 [Stylosanthes scabra]|uniref:Uncharacterized protein n=1 Tax=Stylosanthes scabra TaxID=79078 RepID=A0ABU6XV60_9FABA|nr:hypothetical protein [Stylosanthes scabra]
MVRTVYRPWLVTEVHCVFFGGLGPSWPNIRNSCPELTKANVPGFERVGSWCNHLCFVLVYFALYLGALPILSQGYLDELKLSGVIFGRGELERRYRVEAARLGDRVCYLNLDHPTVPNWLWVNEMMFTEFGVRVPFSDFQ